MAKIFTPDPNDIGNLVQLDPSFERLVQLGWDVKITLQEDYFVSLASAIVGQQLSNRVAEVLWERLLTLTAGHVNPEGIMNLQDEALREIGISYAKIKYLKALAAAVLDGSLALDRIHTLADEEILHQLTRVKGIGPWTAEMFLIFSMGRPDVFSVGDGGLQRAVKWLYQLDEVPGKDELLRISQRWKPYRTTAALYLWRAIDGKLL